MGTTIRQVGENPPPPDPPFFFVHTCPRAQGAPGKKIPTFLLPKCARYAPPPSDGSSCQDEVKQHFPRPVCFFPLPRSDSSSKHSQARIRSCTTHVQVSHSVHCRTLSRSASAPQRRGRSSTHGAPQRPRTRSPCCAPRGRTRPTSRGRAAAVGGGGRPLRACRNGATALPEDFALRRPARGGLHAPGAPSLGG